VWADNDLLARFVRVLMKASEKGAAHTGDVLTLHFNELPMCMGVTRIAPARRALGALCVSLAWHVVVNDLTRTVQITIRNFAKKQNLAPRLPVVISEETPRLRRLPVPVPTPHSKEQDKKASPSFPELAESSASGNGLDADVKAILEGTKNFACLAKPELSDFWQAAEKAYFGDQSPITLEGELEKADAWIFANPRRRPTEKGMRAFVRNWLERAVEKARKAVQVNGKTQGFRRY
jgi:hypothetical protein